VHRRITFERVNPYKCTGGRGSTPTSAQEGHFLRGSTPAQEGHFLRGSTPTSAQGVTF
jgi:hypothetical protein